jgi:hypothetical protein
MKWVMTNLEVATFDIIAITGPYIYPPALYPRQPTGNSRTLHGLLGNYY